jgi:hypothetical protein
MPMRVLLIVAVVLVICLLFAADRAVKAIRRGLRRREVYQRLAAVAAAAEAKHKQRRAVAEASRALTSVMPAIHDLQTRHVDEPSPASTSAAPPGRGTRVPCPGSSPR